MFNSSILDVAIGTIFVFVVVSVVCSAVREGLEALLKTRAAYLEKGIRQMLDDPKGSGLANTLYNHPLIFGLFSGPYEPGKGGTAAPSTFARGGDLPSYIPASAFAQSLMDIAARGAQTSVDANAAAGPAISLESIRTNVANLKNASVQRIMLAAVDAAQGDINRLQTNLETWYNSTMERVGGWYKRSTQWIIFAIGLFVAVSMNINAVAIANALYHDPSVRSAVIEQAKSAASNQSSAGIKYDDAKNDLKGLNLPIGWSAGLPPPRDNRWYVTAAWGLELMFGWMLTAFAASMGAPFWFDVLNKLVGLRSTVKPDEKASQPPVQSPAPAPPSPPAPPPPGPAAPTIRMTIPLRLQSSPDADSSVDACSVKVAAPTPDDQLPASKGGVAL
jgi:hypothetical protein